MSEKQEFIETMKWAFKHAIEKALERKNKEENTYEPWSDCSREHLQDRLWEEIEEWRKAENCEEERDELLDIINISAFLFLRLRLKIKETKK